MINKNCKNTVCILQTSAMYDKAEFPIHFNALDKTFCYFFDNDAFNAKKTLIWFLRVLLSSPHVPIIPRALEVYSAKNNQI